ncbi:MAG: META domain-containing protein [Nocardioides sp.]
MPSDAPGADVELTDLDGATFVSTDVTGQALVPGSQVTLSVEGEVLSVSGGCHTMLGAAEVAEGVLRWKGAAVSALMACPDDLTAQDQWLSGLFGEGMAARQAGEVTIRLAERTEEAVAGVLEGLLAQRRVVVETIDGGIMERVPSSVPTPELEVAADGTVLVFTGCNNGRTSVEVDGDALVFAPTMVTRKACVQAASTGEQRLLAVLGGRVDVTVEGSVAVLMRDGLSGVVVEVG